jgi:hypothetical protein
MMASTVSALVHFSASLGGAQRSPERATQTGDEKNGAGKHIKP